jgi:L-asparaginase
MATKIFALFTGGTISMRRDPLGRGTVAALSAIDIVEKVNGLQEIADLEILDWGHVPASHLSFAQIIELSELLKEALSRDEIAGAVLVQGTDNIEETSYALDLLVDSRKPTVVVGAMRDADDEGYEGAANLRDAVAAAASPLLRAAGVVVAMGGELHAADDVTKQHTLRYGAFSSPNYGPIGHISNGCVAIARTRLSRRVLVTRHAALPVPVITTALGEDGSLIEAARAYGARGIVVQAAGTGNTPAEMLDACAAAIAVGVPVVLTSRCHAGPVSPVYGFPGGGVTWSRAGAIFAGYLPALKARVLLALGLGAGLDIDEIRALYGLHGKRGIVPAGF